MQTAHMPKMPFSGVFSSCEMFAIKSVLLSFAASAALRQVLLTGAKIWAALSDVQAAAQEHV